MRSAITKKNEALDFFGPIKLNRVLVEDMGRFFFSKCLQNQRLIVILVRSRRASGRQIGAKHERAGIGRIQVGKSRTHVEVHAAESRGLDPHAPLRKLQQCRKPCFGKTEMIHADRRERDECLE